MFGENMEKGALIEVKDSVTDEELEDLKEFFKDSAVIRESDIEGYKKWCEKYKRDVSE